MYEFKTKTIYHKDNLIIKKIIYENYEEPNFHVIVHHHFGPTEYYEEVPSFINTDEDVIAFFKMKFEL